jgi:hypothetical protein
MGLSRACSLSAASGMLRVRRSTGTAGFTDDSGRSGKPGIVMGATPPAAESARRVHDFYFSPRYPEFEPRTTWSLSNAFTSAFKDLDPIPQFRATAKLGTF